MQLDSGWFTYLHTSAGVANQNAAWLDSVFVHTRLVVIYADTALTPDSLYFSEKDTATLKIDFASLQDTAIASVDTAFIYRDTVYTYNLTDHLRDLKVFDVATPQNIIYKLFHAGNGYELRRETLRHPIPQNEVEAKPVWDFKHSFDPLPDTADIRFPGRFTNQDDTTFFFQSLFITGKEEFQQAMEQFSDTAATRGREKRTLSNPYFTSFEATGVTGGIDNGPFHSPYVPYTGSTSHIFRPSLNGFAQVELADQMSDRFIRGGFRVPASFNGFDVFGEYETRRGSTDKIVTYWRTTQNQREQNQRQVSQEFSTGFIFPFSRSTSFRTYPFLRHDRTIYPNTIPANMEKTDEHMVLFGSKAEFVVDDTRSFGLNLPVGNRFKVYGEMFNFFSPGHEFMFVAGGDYRHYRKLSYYVLWATRISAAASFGSGKIVYFMGGTEDWLIPNFNQENEVDEQVNYLYQTVAGPMRGFTQNIRNGSNYALVNTELRVPVIRMLSRKPLQSDFFRNLQICAFADAGTSWVGLTPYSEENSINRRHVTTGPLHITIESIRNPIVEGFGFGIRSMLLGQFIRLDYAWGIEDWQLAGQQIFLSAGLDF